MEKVIASLFITITILFTYTQVTYAEEGDWVGQALDATQSFLSEDITSETDKLGIVKTVLPLFTKIVRSINTILLVVLAWISAISISITGVRYIINSGSPEKRSVASKNLKTAFKGMAFGFGAYLIWRIAMGIVQLVLSF